MYGKSEFLKPPIYSRQKNGHPAEFEGVQKFYANIMENEESRGVDDSLVNFCIAGACAHRSTPSE